MRSRGPTLDQLQCLIRRLFANQGMMGECRGTTIARSHGFRSMHRISTWCRIPEGFKRAKRGMTISLAPNDHAYELFSYFELSLFYPLNRNRTAAANASVRRIPTRRHNHHAGLRGESPSDGYRRRFRRPIGHHRILGRYPVCETGWLEQR